MNRLRVVRVAEQFPPGRGGLAPGMLALSLEQHRRGHDVMVITRDTGVPAVWTDELPFEIMRISAESLTRFGWQAAALLRRLRWHPDIVHCHGPAAAPLLFQRRQGHPPVVLTLHAVRRFQYDLYQDLSSLASSVEAVTGIPARNPPRSYRLWSPRIARELMLERYMCQQADHLALVAEFFGRLIADYYRVSEERYSVIYNGSDLRQETGCGARTSEWFNTESDESAILYVGRLDWHKRVHLLVQAMPAVLERVPGARLLVVGDGEQREDLACLISALGLKTRVLLCGWVDHERLHEIYRCAKCLCLPSIYEGLPKVLLEAMSMDVPVIASDILAHQGVLQGGRVGFLVEEPTPDCWASAICAVLSDPARAGERAQLAGELVERAYRWQHVADRLDKVYCGLLSR